VQAGNKGACAVSWSYAEATGRPTRFLAICCHLEAHTHKMNRRNRNAQHILSALHLQPPPGPRGLSQTRFSSFFPSYTSPLRGRSRSRAPSPGLALDACPPLPEAGHTRGHSLPSTAAARIVEELEETAMGRGNVERGGKGGQLHGAGPHRDPLLAGRSLSLPRGMLSPRMQADAADDQIDNGEGWLRGSPAWLLPSTSPKELTPVSEGTEQRGGLLPECSDDELSACEGEAARAPTFRDGATVVPPFASDKRPLTVRLDTAPSFVFGGEQGGREAPTPRLTKCDGATPRGLRRNRDHARGGPVRSPLTSLTWAAAAAITSLPGTPTGGAEGHSLHESACKRHGAQAIKEGHEVAQERDRAPSGTLAPLLGCSSLTCPPQHLPAQAGRGFQVAELREMDGWGVDATIASTPCSKQHVSRMHKTAVVSRPCPGPLGEGEEDSIASECSSMHLGLPTDTNSLSKGHSLQRAGSMGVQRAYVACLTQQAAERGSLTAPILTESSCSAAAPRRLASGSTSPAIASSGGARHEEDMPLLGARQQGRPPIIINSVTPERWQAEFHSAPLLTRPPFPAADISMACANQPRVPMLPPPQPHLRGAPPLVISSSRMEAALAAKAAAAVAVSARSASVTPGRHHQPPPAVMSSSAVTAVAEGVKLVRQSSEDSVTGIGTVECVEGPRSLCCSWPVRCCCLKAVVLTLI
jgi:hypothetical protein